MKAIVYREYGAPDVLRCEEIDRPQACAAGEVLVKVRTASVNPLDWRLVRGQPFLVRMVAGLRRPKNIRLGVDVAGEVAAVGNDVTRFKPGDAVFGGLWRWGSFAEHVCAPEKDLAAKPANIGFDEAAAVTVGAFTAYQGLRGRLQAGEKVLINGAAGGVGTFAVQIARAFGAEVTAVCSARNADMVRSIGAHHVVDYAREDFTSGSQRFDVVFDCMGNRSLLDVRRVMNPRARFVAVGAPGGAWAPIATMMKPLLLSPFVSQRFVPFVSKQSLDDLLSLQRLLEAGTIRPVIDRRYSLEEVPEALRYLEQGHARGKVVITVA